MYKRLLLVSMISVSSLAGAKLYSAKDVLIENKIIMGDIPASQKVRVINHFGNIASRLRDEPRVAFSAAIQKIGPTPATPKFDIQDIEGVRVITVQYPDGQRDADGDFIGRTDVAIVVPAYVSVEMETTWGSAKAKKHFSNLSARTESGDIAFGTTGEVNAHSQSGNVSLDMYNVDWKNPQNVHTDTGDIKLVFAKQANIQISARAQATTHNFQQASFPLSQPNPQQLELSLNQAKSKIALSAPEGQIDLKLIDKPRGGYIHVSPEFDADTHPSLKVTPR